MRIPGIHNVEVSNNGSSSLTSEGLSIWPPETLGRLKPGKITLQIETDNSLLPIVVDGAKNVITRRYSQYGERRKVKTTIMAWEQNASPVFTRYPENNLRLLRCMTQEVTVWEIAVVSQSGAFFLTVQETFVLKLSEGIGGILYGQGSRLQRWPQMMDFLRGMQQRQILVLPDEDPARTSFREVLWWNLAQGLGAVKAKREAARVYWSEVAPRGGFRYLKQGEIIQQCRIMPIVQKPWERATAFRLEAKGVIPPQ